MSQNRGERLQEQLARVHASSIDLDKKTLYIFENHKNHDFALPKKSLCGKKLIGPKQRFKGDDYFLGFVRTGDLRMVETLPPTTIDTPAQLNESIQGANMQKLILDQPDKVTSEGTMEQVVVEQQPRVLKDHAGDQNKQALPDVLLVENPMSGIDIVNG